MRKSARLAAELVDQCGRLGERHVSWHVLRRLCRVADDRTTCGDHDCLRIARIAVRIAGRLVHLRRWRRRPAESAEIALSFGQLATALRSANRLEHAERALAIAFEAAPPQLVGVLHRRRAWVRIFQDRTEEALCDAERAVKLALEEDRALALGTLGAALYHQRRFPEAIARYREALALMDPDDEHFYCGTLVSYAASMAQGTDEEAEEALDLCQRLRSELKPAHKMQRARLWWVEGLLEKRLGRLDEAWRALDMARRSLQALKAAPEVAAVVADMAEVFAEPRAVGLICTEAAEVIAEPHPLAGPLQELAGAGRDLIAEAAAALRAQAGEFAACPAL